MKSGLLGFWGLFADDRGDSTTPKPYPVVTPSRVGPVLLPFPCPHCGACTGSMVDPRYRAIGASGMYQWCPACRKRYEVDLAGAPLAADLPAGATCAPPVAVAHAPAPTGGELAVLGWR